jgi:hypothetical protein
MGMECVRLTYNGEWLPAEEVVEDATDSSARNILHSCHPLVRRLLSSQLIPNVVIIEQTDK